MVITYLYNIMFNVFLMKIIKDQFMMSDAASVHLTLLFRSIHFSSSRKYHNHWSEGQDHGNTYSCLFWGNKNKHTFPDTGRLSTLVWFLKTPLPKFPDRSSDATQRNFSVNRPNSELKGYINLETLGW